MNATLPVTALLVCLLAVGPAHAVFTLDEIQRGLSEDDALRITKGRRLVTEKLKGSEEGYVVKRENGDIRGLFWTCNARVHAASAVQEGGVYAFIDRVADLTKAHGRGEVGADTVVARAGAARTLETYFKTTGDGIVKLSYTPGGAGKAEAIWLQASVPGTCTAK